MFKLNKIADNNNMCDAPYSIIINEQYTIEKFIKEVLNKHINEWGTIKIKSESICSDELKIEYKHGIIIDIYSVYFRDKKKLPQKILSLPIYYAKAYGGYTEINYTLFIYDEI